MVLSSNWLALTKGTKTEKKGTNEIKKTITGKIKRKHAESPKSIEISKKKSFKKPIANRSRIMDMVSQMNKEMEKVEKNRDLPKAEDDALSKLEAKVELENASRSEFKSNEVGKYVAIDCEFVGVGPEGKESALARVSIVNYFGNVVLDHFVKPEETVTDWRTWVSGIQPHHMLHAISAEESREHVASVIDGRVLIGHSVHHDLKVLMLSHPKSMIRDTSRHIPFREKYSNGKTPALKKLMKEILKIDIQSKEHSSIEDARATMLLYKSDKKEFERLHRQKFGATA